MEDMRSVYLDEYEWLCAKCRELGDMREQSLHEHYEVEHPGFLD